MKAAAAALMLLATGGAVATARPAGPDGPVLQTTAPGVFHLTGAMRQGGLMRGVVPAGAGDLRFDGMPVPVAADGGFVIAFDRDAPSTALLQATLAVGGTVRQALAVAAGDWPIERVDAAPTGGRSPAAFARERAGELAQIAAARARVTAADGWRGPFAWPVAGRLSGRFGAQRIYRGVPGSFHSGTDIAAPTGTPLLAPADGVVVLASEQPFSLEGRLLVIDHGMGLNSAFLHLSRIDVAAGQAVRRGQPLGAIGATGRASGPHMHWSLKWRDARIDPALVAGPMG